MQRPLPDLGEWPPLECEQWKDTAETLHVFMQIGKPRLIVMQFLSDRRITYRS